MAASLKYVKPIDGLRGLAVLLVFFFHLDHFSFGFFGLKFGWIGVQIFFVLSGFLITKILLNERDKDFKVYIGKFYWRRVLRIFPIYFSYISVFALIYLITNYPDDFNQHAPFLFTYTYNFTRFFSDIKSEPLFIHLWSLSVEEQFYLVWPLCIFFLRGRSLKYFVLILVLGVPFVRYFLHEILVHSSLKSDYIGEAIYGFTISHFDAFAIGGAIPIFNLDEKNIPFKLIFWISLVILLIAGGINILLIKMEGLYVSLLSLGFPIGGLENGQYIWSYTLMNICFGSLTLYLIRSDYRGIFNNNLLVFTGKISYGIYLYHFATLMFFQWLYQYLKLNDFIYSVLSLSFTYLISYLSYRFYERKFLSLKDRFFSHAVKII